MTLDTMRQIDTGTGYGRKPGTHDAALVEVGPGTPMGELMRRYWHPVGRAADATTTPKRVRALGEDLILFRDATGRPGLLHARCSHRGTTLYYGHVDARGIRCCYHGWLYDAEGHCLEQPCEPDGGRQRAAIRQPWYPLQERYGLIFAYMGPPERKPVLPRYDVLEALEPGEFIEPDVRSFGSGGPAVVPCNWLQYVENVLDGYHVPILHGSFSGNQFTPEMAVMPEAHWDYTELGAKTWTVRQLDGGRILDSVVEVIVPTIRSIPDSMMTIMGRSRSVDWTLPIDDTSFTVYRATRVKQAGDGLVKRREYINGKSWDEMTEAEHQACPNDYEAQTGQGPITLHSDEHLVTSDRGVAMLRHLLKLQLAAIADGKDPLGVVFDERRATVTISAGSFIRPA